MTPEKKAPGVSPALKGTPHDATILLLAGASIKSECADREDAMNGRAASAVIHGFKEAPSVAHKLVLAVLAAFADRNGLASPTLATIANRCGISERHTRRLLGDVVGTGFLAVVGNRDGGRAPRLYRINVEALEAAAVRGLQ